MIQLFGSDRHTIGLFQDFDELFNHINAIENAKIIDSSPCFPDEIWSFVLFTNKRLSYIYYKTLERSFSKVGKEAFEQELDLLEISKGDYENPLHIPVTPDVNIQELKKNWCQDYCDAHDYILVDTQSSFGAISAARGVTERNKEGYARVHMPRG